jgi:hypothetical protein
LLIRLISVIVGLIGHSNIKELLIYKKKLITLDVIVRSKTTIR